MINEPTRGPITVKRAKREVAAELSSRDASSGMFPSDRKSLSLYGLIVAILAIVIILAWVSL